MANKEAVKKKVTKKATKKGVTKKATKKVAKKKVSKKVAKKATRKKVSTTKSKKVVAKKLTKEEKAEIKEQKAMELKLAKEFDSLKFKGTLRIGMDSKDALLMRKETEHDCVNEVMNDLLTAFEASLVAKELAPVFQNAVFNDLKSKQI